MEKAYLDIFKKTANQLDQHLFSQYQLKTILAEVLALANNFLDLQFIIDGLLAARKKTIAKPSGRNKSLK